MGSFDESPDNLLKRRSVPAKPMNLEILFAKQEDQYHESPDLLFPGSFYDALDFLLNRRSVPAKPMNLPVSHGTDS